MIHNARNKNLNDSVTTVPDVSAAIMSLLRPMQFILVKKQQIAGETQEIKRQVLTMASRQPLKAQQLILKPEGQRAWKWEKIHAIPEYELYVDDIIVFNGINYRVMEKTNYSEYGFVEYDIAQDFTEKHVD